MRHVTKQSRRPAMAVPNKKDNRTVFSVSAILGYFKSAVGLIKRRIAISLTIFFLVILVIVAFNTSLFSINNISYDFSDSDIECVSEDIISKAYFDEKPKIWSHYFFDSQKLKSKYLCLDNITFSWNPLYFNILKVSVSSSKPIARVVISKIDDYNTGVLREEIRYVTKEGRIITLVSQPDLPSFRYRISKDQNVDLINLSAADVESVIKLQKYLSTELKITSELDWAYDGSIRFRAPFAEEIYITLRDDLSIQLGSLQAILLASTIDKNKIQLIDLRFGNPVIHFR